MTDRTVRKAKKSNAVHLLLDKFWSPKSGWQAVRGMQAGFTCAQSSQTPPTDPIEIAKQDVTIVVCMLNGIAREGQ